MLTKTDKCVVYVPVDEYKDKVVRIEGADATLLLEYFLSASNKKQKSDI